ncbi:unnamed protein product [Arabidopsis halleri]
MNRNHRWCPASEEMMITTSKKNFRLISRLNSTDRVMSERSRRRICLCLREREREEKHKTIFFLLFVHFWTNQHATHVAS